MAQIRCYRCRGQKKYFGMGGIEKECEKCDGIGKIEHEATAKESLMVESNVSTVSMSELLADAGVPATVIQEMANAKPRPLMDGYDDEFVRAILEETGMDPLMWAAKYKHVKSLFGVSPITGRPEELISKVARAGIRAQYASNQAMAPKTVDMSASQDAVAGKDGEYKAYVQQEKLRTEKILSTAEKKKASMIKNG